MKITQHTIQRLPFLLNFISFHLFSLNRPRKENTAARTSTQSIDFDIYTLNNNQTEKKGKKTTKNKLNLNSFLLLTKKKFGKIPKVYWTRTHQCEWNDLVFVVCQMANWIVDFKFNIDDMKKTQPILTHNSYNNLKKIKPIVQTQRNEFYLVVKSYGRWCWWFKTEIPVQKKNHADVTATALI